MDRKKKKQYSGLYAAICCFAVVAGIIGFAGTRNKKHNENGENAQQIHLNDDSIAGKTEAEVLVPDYEEDEPVKTVQAESNTVKEEEEFILARPVHGKVICEYSGDELIYNEALKDWRTHNGIDLEAKPGEQVFAAANGIVDRVFDSNMGCTVIINHQNGYKTVYSNLAEDITLKKDDEIAEGDVVGTVGNTALGDATELSHLHFELLYKEENVNPTDFLE